MKLSQRAGQLRHVKTDLWLMPVKGGGKPVRLDGVFIHRTARSVARRGAPPAGPPLQSGVSRRRA
ncbi:hypothetical protein ETD86_20465 [Nonomuraea turkmeniaca]|uniref:Uncharacterized protein n=1 Tax=Nonomuraea turkmeniaca TaxID=103838 RepID=A0A5S4FH16_9ACTN|nr:hypothetical protein [Nonomuraea turkmeniaca]TMR19240.1 hypothetical protein ETD86_20465 [Nonomuraea turkmeniaca]